MRRLAAGLLVGAAVGIAVGCSGESDSTEPPPGPFEEDCVAQCEFEGGCFGVDAELCSRGCEVLAQRYPSGCRDLYSTMARCEVSLGCDGAHDFAENPREHAECGAAWTEFVTVCGFGGGTPPDECDAFCVNAEACAPDSFYGTCADNCDVTLGLMDALYGSDCAEAYVDVFACEATLDCNEIQGLLEGAPPTSCQAPGLAAATWCQ